MSHILEDNSGTREHEGTNINASADLLDRRDR
jgi:hypothetical protein